MKPTKGTPMDPSTKPYGAGMPCPTCGQGTIQPKVIKNHKTRIFGAPFVVPEAYVGICDNPECDERITAGEEIERWRTLFNQHLEEQHLVLMPEELTALRRHLGLTKKDFAHLTGFSLRSVVNWEKPDRKVPPSPAANRLFKVLSTSLEEGPIDVIDLLLEEAKKAGHTIELQRAGVDLTRA